MAKIRPMRPEEKEAERIFEMAMKHWQDTGLSPNSKKTVPSLYEQIDLLEDPLLQKRIEGLRDCRQKGNTFAYDHYDIQTWVMQRKKKVCMKYYPQAVKRLKPLYRRSNFDTEYFLANTMGGNGGYNSIGGQIVAASAIWILDQLALQGDLPQLYELLPEDLPLGDVNQWLVHYQPYPRDLSVALYQLLLIRNTGLIKENGVEGPLVCEFRERANRENAPYRQAVDQILKLLDPKKIRQLCRDYEEKVWEFFGLGMAAAQAIADAREKLEQEAPIQRPAVPFAVYAPSKLSQTQKTASEEYVDSVSKARTLAVFDARTNGCFSNTLTVNAREKYAYELEDVYGKGLSHKIRTFTVDDPFDTAFALFYMLDQGSDIPWIYYGSLGVAYTAVDRLPFYIQSMEKSEECSVTGLMPQLHQGRYEGGKHPGELDIDHEPIMRKIGLTAGQLFYANTDSVFPRVVREIPELEKTLDKLEENPHSTRELYTMLLQLMNGITSKAESLQSWRDRNAEEPKEETEQVSPEELKRQLKEARLENQNLRRVLHERDAEERQTNADVLAIQQEQKRNIQELTELRSLLFRLNSQEPGDDAVPQNLTFPCSTRERRIVSFGGHPGWMKNIKALLPDVRFVSTDELPNRDMIRNADEIWLQTNYMSHAFYYGIIDTVRSSGKELHYFQYSSAEKCAEQLVCTVKKT